MEVNGTLDYDLQVNGNLSSIYTITNQELSKVLNISAQLSKINIITASVERVDGRISATLTGIPTLEATLTQSNQLSGEISPGNYTYNDEDREFYLGPYEVVSSPREDQSLDTAQKVMSQNMTILKIPYYETINLSGGYTVTISE